VSAVEFTREMGFTREEFMRILPAATAGRALKTHNNEIEVTVNRGSLTITLGEQRVRKIASLALPYLTVGFTFKNLVESEVSDFMDYFDLRYQRGGG